ncbi:hypothetical protein C6500_21405 [Candidatus Poribacteria bacterium]|nr:MAG: hypothetical protein C6500_21405 [Candidatus Poribacteria bacterium]
MNEPLKGFITYSHDDTEAKNELRKRLAVMEQQNELVTWDDGQLTPGDGALQEDILKNVADSDMLLYLVSAASLASKNCNKELTEALKREIRVIPIILEHCDWLHHQLSGFEVLPHKGKPISKSEDESEGWQNVVEGIRKAVDEMRFQANSSSESAQNSQLDEWVFQQGNFLMILQEIDRAIEAYSHAIELNSDNADAYNNRAVAYANKGNFDNAIKDHNTAIKLNPCQAGLYNNRGATYVDQKDFDNGIHNYNMAIQLDSHYTEAYYNRGIAYDAKDAVDKAIIDYDAAIKLNPHHAEAYNNRGIAYSRKNKLDNAIQDFNMAIQINPYHTEAYYNRGIAYTNKNDFDNAIADYTIAMKLRPDSDDPYYNRGNAYLTKGDFEKAITDYTTAARINPHHASTYYNRGIAYFNKGEFDEAITDYTRAIRIDPYHANAYNNRGSVYSGKGEFDLAIRNYNTAIELNPRLDLAYYNRGVARLHQREWAKAKVDLMNAKRIGMDIVALFHNSYKGVEKFEKHFGFKLPEDIAHFLTERLRTRYPKTRSVLDADGNPLESPNVLNLLSQLRNAGMPLGEYVKTKPAFGINTTPTEVFVIDKATRDKLIAEHPSSSDILKPFLDGKDLRRWHVDTPQQWLIYTHRRITIKDYPAILKHLEKYREILNKRKGKQKWYELQASLRDTERFAQSKLVCPDSYNHQTFAVDTSGYYYGKTTYLIPTEETWLCGLLNSRTVEWFYSQVSNQLTIDPLRARSGYIQQIPIPDITTAHKALIAKIVDYLIYLQQQPTINSKDLKYARDRVMLGYLERVIDGLVYEAYLPEDLHKGNKHFFQPLLDEQLPLCEEIQGDKMSALRDIFELLYEKTHPIRRNLFFLDSVKPVRVIQGKL